MAKKLEVPYNGTKEQEEQLRTAIGEIAKAHAGKGLTIAALQKGQEIFGYLPEKALQIISEALGVPLAEVYGVATFYAQFSLYPKGQYKIGVCLGTACYVKGSGDVYQRRIEDQGRRMHGRSEIFAGRDALHRLLRACARDDRQRRRVRQSHAGRGA